MTETQFKQKVKIFLKKHNIYNIPYYPGEFGKPGIPDTLMIIKGLFVGIEFKTDTGKVSELQKIQIKRINDNGGLAFILRPKNYEIFKENILILNNNQYIKDIANLKLQNMG